MAKTPRPPKSQPLFPEGSAPLQGGRRRKRDPDQPQLLFDPMPDRVEPALALLKQKPPTSDAWRDVKWDGYRLHVHIEPTRIRIITRRGYDWTSRFPAIEEAARALQPTTMILDGAVVTLDDQGRSDFNLLQSSLGASGRKRFSHVARAPICL